MQACKSDMARLGCSQSPVFPLYDKLTPENIVTSLQQLFADLDSGITALEAATPDSWDALLDPYERLGDRLNMAWGVVEHLQVWPHALLPAWCPPGRMRHSCCPDLRTRTLHAVFPARSWACQHAAWLLCPELRTGTLHAGTCSTVRRGGCHLSASLLHAQEVKNSDELRSAIAEVQDDNVRLGNRFAESRQLYDAFSRMQNSTNLTEVQERIVEGILLTGLQGGVTLQVCELLSRQMPDIAAK